MYGLSSLKKKFKNKLFEVYIKRNIKKIIRQNHTSILRLSKRDFRPSNKDPVPGP